MCTDALCKKLNMNVNILMTECTRIFYKYSIYVNNNTYYNSIVLSAVCFEKKITELSCFDRKMNGGWVRAYKFCELCISCEGTLKALVHWQFFRAIQLSNAVAH